MREIKFRVWDKNIPKTVGELENPTGEMVEWDYIKESDYLIDGINGKYPIMQYTGLKDKNGKEVYTGDILKLEDCGEALYEVKYFDYVYAYGVERINPQKGDWIDKRLEELYSEGIEVIGNIYENKELLEIRK